MGRNIIKLNVDGQKFQTLESTLMKYDTMIKRMLLSEILAIKDEENAIFIDRDGKFFKYILDFMRDEEMTLPEDRKMLKEIKNEARYYGLQELEQLIVEKMRKCSGMLEGYDLPIVFLKKKKEELIEENETKLLKPSEVDNNDKGKMIFARKGLLPTKPLPLVVYVHGGPYTRDRIDYNRKRIFLTSLGISVLQVNYRGSRHFGRYYGDAMVREFGRKMQTDLEDGVKLLVQLGIADEKKVVIYGASYGGYATLVGMTCLIGSCIYAGGIAEVSVSNFTHLLAEYKYEDKNLDVYREIDELNLRSPVYFAQDVQKPILLVHGEKDTITRKIQADMYISFPNEGHGITNYWNVLQYFAEMEAFLDMVVGTLYDATEAGHYNESTIKVEFDNLYEFVPKTRKATVHRYVMTYEELKRHEKYYIPDKLKLEKSRIPSL